MTDVPTATGVRHRFRLRIQCEDTDCTGFVHHASWLRFLARARFEAMAAAGRSPAQWAEHGVMFPVYSIGLTIHAPARLGDELEVFSNPRVASAFRLGFDQRIEDVRDRKVLVEAKVDLVCTDLKANLRGLPEMAL